MVSVVMVSNKQQKDVQSILTCSLVNVESFSLHALKKLSGKTLATF
ncbi:MAG: hypothetical protein CG442_797, partial [Methylococcaceae bacterium NSO1]